MARLDRLGVVRQIAQIGAVIGREFSYGLLEAIAPSAGADLTATLDQLVAAELIFQRGVPPQASYRFKHALVQEVAYRSLPKGRRQQLHAAVAQALEERGSRHAAGRAGGTCASSHGSRSARACYHLLA